MSDWKPTACLICSLNYGIEVQTEGGHNTRVRADKNHPVSQGYLCEKAQRMFEAILGLPSGTVFARQDSEDSWKRLSSPGQQISLHIPEMIEALLAPDPAAAPRDAEYPFILSAGERRTETSNTSIRNPDWLRKGELESTLRIHPDDAAALGLADGVPVEVVSRRARARSGGVPRGQPPRPCLAAQRAGARRGGARWRDRAPRGRIERTHRLPLARSRGGHALAQICAGAARTRGLKAQLVSTW
ncbi:MAG: molybdopterin dinucleotide binding domain-containing protein [Erythrobacter sp.]